MRDKKMGDRKMRVKKNERQKNGRQKNERQKNGKGILLYFVLCSAVINLTRNLLPKSNLNCIVSLEREFSTK